MKTSPQSVDSPPTSLKDYVSPPVEQEISSSFDPYAWRASEAQAEIHGAGGRQVLGSALVILAALWLGYIAWAAGKALAGQPLASPAMAQWLALAAGPLALLGLCWILFGRTRRKEAERFTRSVIEMRAEARSLEGLLGVLSERIQDNRTELTMIAQHLMQLGDDTTSKLGGITREFDSSTDKLAKHGLALDRAAESARNDIAVLLDDLPRAEATARSMSEQLQVAGTAASRHASGFAEQVNALSAGAKSAESVVSTAVAQLLDHLSRVESSGTAAAASITDANARMVNTTDQLLTRAAASLEQIRSGIDTQAAAVASLVEQSSAGIGRTGAEAAESLASNVSAANVALDGLTSRIAEQERASHRIVAETARALAELDQHFAGLAETGDQRAAAFAKSIGRARSELQQLSEETGTQNSAVEALAERAEALQNHVGRLTNDVKDQLSIAIGDAEAGTERLIRSTERIRPELDWMRDAAVEASERIRSSASSIAEQQDRFATLLATLDEGVGTAGERIGTLAAAITEAQGEATRLSHETGPALIDAMVQVKEAASHAAERAREAIANVVPQSAAKLSDATRDALQKVIREEVEARLAEVEATAARAVDAARGASDRLTEQMLSIGRTAAALEQHMEQINSQQREKDSETFARRVALLIDSMHSASIDVGKLLSDEVDEKAWDSYLKGNRGVFTRRAVRLLEGSETRAIKAHYDADIEFQEAVHRYVHDFEAMMRRVVADKDGGIIAVTLMSSDTGKLYAALAQVVDKRR
jgi:archaellum component FlaC